MSPPKEEQTMHDLKRKNEIDAMAWEIYVKLVTNSSVESRYAPTMAKASYDRVYAFRKERFKQNVVKAMNKESK